MSLDLLNQLTHGWAVLDLADVAMVELRGPDARRFANGMFTNNVRDLPVGGCQRTSMCDDRGRLLGLMDLVLLSESRLLLGLEGATAAQLAAHLATYIVFDDVEVVDLGEGHPQAVVGPQAAAHLHSLGAPAPSEGAARWGEGVVWPRSRAGLPGFTVWGAHLGEATLSSSLFDVARVLAGQPSWPGDAPRRLLPMELGLKDHVLHFEKGCYIGQETIHRVDVQGKVRRALRVLSFATEPPAAGTEVVFAGKRAGVLTSPVVWPGPSGGGYALAVLTEAAQAGPVRCGDQPAEVSLPPVAWPDALTP